MQSTGLEPTQLRRPPTALARAATPTSRDATPNGTQKGSLIAIPPRLLPGLGLQTDLARSLAWTLTH